MNSCQQALKALRLPLEFTQQEIELLCNHPHGMKQVEAGEILIEEGANDRDIWLLVQGQFQVVKKIHPTLPLGILRAGSFCGEIAWFTGQVRTASVIAMEPGLALRFSFQAIKTYEMDLLLKLYHNTLVNLMGRLEMMNQLLFKLAGLESKQFGGSVGSSPVGYLQGLSFFADFTSEEEHIVRKLQPVLTYIAPGQFIFKAGQKYDFLFVLLKGSVKVSLNEDLALVLLLLGSERVLGLNGFFQHEVQTTNMVAMEPCVGLRVSIDQFNSLSAALKLKFYWQFALNLINRLAPFNIAKIKLEHMEGNVWFGG